MARVISVRTTAQESWRASTPAQRPSNLDFDAVYAREFDFVWRNLRRLGVRESAMRDAAQEVFMVVHRRLNEFVPQGSIRSWLYSILRRVAAAQHRRNQRRSKYEIHDDVAPEGQATTDPEREMLRGRALRRLLELLDDLDEDKKNALILVDLEDLSVPEACAALEVNPNTLYSRLRAARIQLRQSFAQGDPDWRQP